MRFVVGIVGALLAPSIVVAADAPADRARPCVDVQIGNVRTPDYDCLNRQLEQKVDHEHQMQPAEAPLGAHSSPAAVGLATSAAAREMAASQAALRRSPPIAAPQLGGGFGSHH